MGETIHNCGFNSNQHLSAVGIWLGDMSYLHIIRHISPWNGSHYNLWAVSLKTQEHFLKISVKKITDIIVILLVY